MAKHTNIYKKKYRSNNEFNLAVFFLFLMSMVNLRNTVYIKGTRDFVGVNHRNITEESFILLM